MRNESTGHLQHAVPTPQAEIVSILQPRPGERILDVGCGNGAMTARLAAAGARTTGIDRSEEMLRKARLSYPEVDFQVADARHFRTDTRFDAVFSHAALHWIPDAEVVARTVWLALSEGGRFVAEFAGHGNVAVLTDAMRQALASRGYDWKGRSPWYLPTIGEYASLLEAAGFNVTMAQHFGQLSPLRGEKGIRGWLDSFAEYFFHDVPDTDKREMFEDIEEAVRPRLLKDGQWAVDTCRLRIVAVKPRGEGVSRSL